MLLPQLDLCKCVSNIKAYSLCVYVVACVYVSVCVGVMGVFHSPQYFSKVVIILSGHRGIDFVFPVRHLCQVIGQRLSEYVFIHVLRKPTLYNFCAEKHQLYIVF